MICLALNLTRKGESTRIRIRPIWVIVIQAIRVSYHVVRGLIHVLYEYTTCCFLIASRCYTSSGYTIINIYHRIIYIYVCFGIDYIIRSERRSEGFNHLRAANCYDNGRENISLEFLEAGISSVTCMVGSDLIIQ